MRPITFLVAVVTATPFTGVIAQEPTLIERGARVRLTYCLPTLGTIKCLQEQGKLRTLATDSVALDVAGQTLWLIVPFASVTQLEVGQTPPATMHVVGVAVFGSVPGAIVGGAVMAVVNSLRCYNILDIEDPDCERKKTRDGSKYVTWGVVVGTLGGAVVGAVVGHQDLRWTEVPLDRLHVNLGPQRDGRFGFGLSVRF